MEPKSPGENSSGTIKFRAGKKRKAYRQRTDEDEEAPTSSTQPSAQAQETNTSEVKEDDEPSVAAALRLRNARKSRLRGVGFTTSRPDEEMSAALVPRYHDDSEEVALPSMANRFTHQTGVLADIDDKHMMEYIESRLSNRAAPASSSTIQEAPASMSNAPEQQPKPESREILQGHLMEIDITKEAENERLAKEETRDGRGKRRRLGKDGKPWRPRNRRGSDAIKRDQLVEEILRENRLDVYDVPSQPPDTGTEADGAADERLAEEFRRQFLDDVAERQMKKKKAAQPARPGAEEVLKGPKLGGSRNVRAAMRDMLLKKEKDGKK